MSFDCQLNSSLRQSSITDQYLHMRYIYVHTVDGRNPAPVDKYFIQLFLGLYISQVVKRISLFHGSYNISTQPKHGKCCEVFEDRRFPSLKHVISVCGALWRSRAMGLQWVKPPREGDIWLTSWGGQLRSFQEWSNE